MSDGRSQTGGIGWVVLILALGVSAILLGSIEYDTKGMPTGTFVEKFLALRPSEMGDTLAGVFGSLAFAVATVAIVMQSRELMYQREELRLTREVMKEQSKAAQDAASSMKAQAAIFEHEQKDRVQQSTDKELEALVGELAACLLSPELKSLVWELDLDAHPEQRNIVRTGNIVRSDGGFRRLRISPQEGADLFSRVGRQLHELTSQMFEIKLSLKKTGFVRKPVRGVIVLRILSMISKINQRSSEGSEAMNSKLRVARLTDSDLSYEHIKDFEQYEELWAPE